MLRPGRRIHRHLIDMLVGTGAGQDQIDVVGLSLHQNGVAVDPPALDEIHIVIDHIAVYRIHQLPVAQIGEEVWLHDADLHPRIPPCQMVKSQSQSRSSGAFLSFSDSTGTIPSGQTRPIWGSSYRMERSFSLE